MNRAPQNGPASMAIARPILSSRVLALLEVMGGYVVPFGAFTSSVALTSFALPDRRDVPTGFYAGLFSMVWISVVNFLVDLEFRREIRSFAFLQAGAPGASWIKERLLVPMGSNTREVAHDGH